MKPTDKTAAICGLFCGVCPFYPEKCHGCLSDKLTEHCVSCPNGFRKCAKENNVTRCNECSKFPCSRIEKFSNEHWENGIGHHCGVINNLVEMNKHGIEHWVLKKTEENTCKKCGKLIYWMDKNSHKCIK
ncbi:MAG: DUF3795 domain-containing protein [Oscillospiraceae bacterium]